LKQNDFIWHEKKLKCKKNHEKNEKQGGFGSPWSESSNVTTLALGSQLKQGLTKVRVTTLALGSWPKQWLMNVQAKSEAQELHFMFLGVWESVSEWTFTLLNELPL